MLTWMHVPGSSLTAKRPRAGEFRQQALYRGGPVADSHLHILHGHPMADAREIVDVRLGSWGVFGRC